jgi:predicted AlkP superfamily phosphohydrolase/phosphomutase
MMPVSTAVGTPICIIGLDGASFELLDTLVAEGVMPTLSRLLARGTRAKLRSTVPPITPAAWASFMTGKRPGKHGIYDFRIYDPRTYRDRFVTSRALRDHTLWSLLTAAGRRTAVVNLPVMYPPPPASGIVVSGFDTPGTDAEFTAPRELRQRILAELPDYAFIALPSAGDSELVRDDSFGAFVDRIERGLEQRTHVALALLADGPFDVFMLHHQETDALQHKTWPILVEPSRSPERAARLRQTYRRLDDRLGALLARFPEEALVIVVSDHGFGMQTGRVFPNVLLRQWGYLHGPSRWRARLRRSLGKRLRRLGLAKRSEPSTGGRWDQRVRAHSFERALPLRWRTTRAYVAAAEIYGLLYVNQRGREPHGIVAPGRERDTLCEEIRGRFLALRDPADGAPIFSDVLEGSHVDPDDLTGRRPDLVLVPRPGFSVYRELNDRRWLDRYDRPSGTHRPDGIFIASGPMVRAGALPETVAIVDVAPTVLAAAGVPVPDDMDGRVLTELFVTPPEVAYAAARAPTDVTTDVLSDEDERAVTERLRALGYLT